MTLWLIFGTFAALVVVWVGIKANVDRARVPVEGSSPPQQASADSVLEEIQRDSTNVSARTQLGNILYDTGNWGDAIVHYRAAIRMDSTLTPTIVDLGVCYYNLGASKEAERTFLLALARDPHHPVAHFNLGIVYEGRKDYQHALEHFHLALQSAPPESMKPALMEAMGRVQKQLGVAAPPLRK
jgi:tetratricopeptide (TPR) repeat protein